MTKALVGFLATASIGRSTIGYWRWMRWPIIMNLSAV